MNMTWIICKREMSVFFGSLTAYIIMILFISFTGFFTWIYGSDIFFRGEASLVSFFTTAFWTIFFIYSGYHYADACRRSKRRNTRMAHDQAHC